MVVGLVTSLFLMSLLLSNPSTLAAGSSPWPTFRHDTMHTGASDVFGAQTATLRWTIATGGIVWSSPSIGSDGTIYIGSADDNLYAVSPSGSLKWGYTTNNQVWSSPAIGNNGIIYVGSADGVLYAFYPNGTLEWKYSTGV